MNSIRALGYSLEQGLIASTEGINKGLNGFETELNFSRVGSGILGTIVNFPKVYKMVTDQEASRFFTVFSDALGPVNAVVGQFKTCLNFFELSIRLSKIRELSARDQREDGALKRNWQQCIALGLQCAQKADESIFIEPTGKKWSWYHLDTATGGFTRWTGIKVSSLALLIIKDACVFFASIFAQWGAVYEKAAVLKKLRRKEDEVAKFEKGETPATVAEYAAKLAQTEANIVEQRKKLNELGAIKKEPLPTKQTSYYVLLIKENEKESEKLTTRLNSIKKAMTERPQDFTRNARIQYQYDRFITWFQQWGLGVELQRLKAAKAQPSIQECTIDADLEQRINTLTVRFNANLLKADRQFVLSSTSANAKQREIVLEYKQSKKEAQVANLKYQEDKFWWAKLFDISKMTIAPLGTLCVLKDECSPTGFIGRQFAQTPHIGKALEVLLFINIFVTSAIGFGRTYHLAYVKQTPLPQPRILEGVRR